MGFLEEGVGPDTISDLTTNAIFPALEEITKEVCHAYNIPLETFNIDGREVLLPLNPFQKGRTGIALVPSDILRDLPIATDWSDVSRVAFENEKIRRRVNELIANFATATIRQKKAALRKAALQSKEGFRALFEGLVETDEAYDFAKDKSGLRVLREGLREVPARYPLQIIAPSGPSQIELARVVREITAQFRKLIENNDLGICFGVKTSRVMRRWLSCYSLGSQMVIAEPIILTFRRKLTAEVDRSISSFRPDILAVI